MTGGRQRWDGFYTLGLCAVVLAGNFLVDAVLERRELAAMHQTESAAAQQEQSKPLSSAEIPDVMMTGFQFLHALPKPESTPLWELKASSAAMFEQRQEATLQMIHAVFQPDAVRGTSGGELEGEQGQLELGRLNFDVMGTSRPVTVRFGQRYTLTTRQLRWDNASARMTTDLPVQIVGQGLTVTGTGFQWLQSDGTISVLRDIHTVVTQ